MRYVVYHLNQPLNICCIIRVIAERIRRYLPAEVSSVLEKPAREPVRISNSTNAHLVLKELDLSNRLIVRLEL